MKSLFTWLPLLALVPALVGLTGCELDDDPDHVPPAGFGAIIIENDTPEDIRIYIDGADKGEVSDFSDRPYDLLPGTYRVVMDQEDTRRSWRGDVDVLDGRLSILRVENDYDDLDVIIYFE